MSVNLKLHRVTFSKDSPTYGVLLCQGLPICVTLENPWLDNAEGVSCIPPGVYQCVPHNSPKHPNTWQLLSVPGRTEILIHQGNYQKDTAGCLLVGRAFFNGSITSSADTLDELRQKLPDTFTLEIVNP